MGRLQQGQHILTMLLSQDPHIVEALDVAVAEETLNSEDLAEAVEGR